MPTIEIVADFVCPWCFIGLRRLALALAEVRRGQADFRCWILWRPFFLNPDTPPAGEPYRPFLERKFGSGDAVEALFERVREAGRPDGVDFVFEAIRLRANTLPAHRLVHWAQQGGDATPLVERLFVAQFQRGEHIGDPALLAAIAGECGYSAEAAAAYLASDAEVAEVRDMEARYRAMGVSAVPTFILDGRRAVVGAETPGGLAAAIRDQFA